MRNYRTIYFTTEICIKFSTSSSLYVIKSWYRNTKDIRRRGQDSRNALQVGDAVRS